MKLFHRNTEKIEEDNRSMREKIITECENMKFTIFSSKEDISDVKHLYYNLLRTDSLCFNMCPDQFECVNACKTAHMFCTNNNMKDYHMCTECWKYNLGEYPNDENLDSVQLRNKIYDDIVLNRYRYAYNNRRVMITPHGDYATYEKVDNIVKNSEGKFVAQLSNEMEIEVLDPKEDDGFAVDVHEIEINVFYPEKEDGFGMDVRFKYKVKMLPDKNDPILTKPEDPVEFATVNA